VPWKGAMAIRISSVDEDEKKPCHINPQIHANKCSSGRGLMAWLWLAWTPGQAKALMKPGSWPSLAWPNWAWLWLAHGLRPGHAHH